VSKELQHAGVAGGFTYSERRIKIGQNDQNECSTKKKLNHVILNLVLCKTGLYLSNGFNSAAKCTLQNNSWQRSNLIRFPSFFYQKQCHSSISYSLTLKRKR